MAIFVPDVVPYSVKAEPMGKRERKRFAKLRRVWEKTKAYRGIAVTELKALRAGEAIWFYTFGWPCQDLKLKSTGIVRRRRGLMVEAVCGSHVFAIQLSASHPGAAEWRRSLALRKVRRMEESVAKNKKLRHLFEALHEMREDWTWKESEFDAKASSLAYAANLTEKDRVLATGFCQLLHQAYRK